MKPPRLLQRLSKTSNPHDTLKPAFAFNTKVRIVHSGSIGYANSHLHLSRLHVKPSDILFSSVISVGHGKT